MIRILKKYRWEIAYAAIGITLTVLARDYAVTRRVSMGLAPSWGGEFLIVPLMIIMYASVKADWSVD